MTKQIDNIYSALAVVQGEIKNPEKTKEATAGRFNYRYADIADVLEEVLPVLSKHGISVIQPTRIEENSVILKTRLTHGPSETFVECDYPVSSVNQDHQKLGGALTYARRFALCSMVGVAPAEDLDGQDAAKSGDGDRPQLSSQAAKKEINWDAIISRIRQAPSQDKLDDAQKYVDGNKGYWPASFVASASEEIQNRRDELELQARASGFDDPMEAFETCETVDQVLRMQDALIQLGTHDESHVRELADKAKAWIKEGPQDMFPGDA